MKTKNILLTAIAIAVGTLLSTPVFAQDDYHEISDIIKEAVTENTQKNNYIEVNSMLLLVIMQNLPVNLDEIKTAAQRTVADGKLYYRDRYNLLTFCIMYNRNDILRILLEAGFLYDNLSFPVRRSLPEIALDVDNLEAFFILISSFQFKIMEALSDEDKADILKPISELSEERQQELKKTIISIWQNDRVNHQFYLGFFNEDEFERALDNPYSAYDLFVKAKEGIESGIIDNGLYEGLSIMSIEKQFEYLSRAIRAKKNDVLLVLLTAGFADALDVEKIDSLRVLAHENQNEIAYIMLVPYELKK